MNRKLKPVSPGEMLAEEFLKPLGAVEDALEDQTVEGDGRAGGGRALTEKGRNS